MSFQKLYELAPVWMQNIMCSVKGWFIIRRRYNRGFSVELKRYESHYYKQAECLIRMLESSCDMDVYKSYLGDVDWNLVKTRPSLVYDVIAKFPIIDKVEVKNHITDYNNREYRGKRIIMKTSGTTGGGLVFPYSVEMENKQWAVWWRYRRALGIDLDTWCGWFGGKAIVPRDTKGTIFWRVNRPGKQVMFSSYHLTRKTVSLYYREIENRGLTWLHGYPSHITRLASYLIDEGFEPLTGVKYITTGAENVLGNQITVIQKAFPRAIIRQHYGLNEGVANVSQNESGEWIVDDDFCYVEFIPVSKEDHNVCRIVGTGFSNLAFPLIRYDTGDVATVERNIAGKVIKVVSIDGRSSNVLHQPSGHDIVEASLSIVLHDFSNIVEAQFHQNSLKDIELWVVRGDHYSDSDEAKLRSALDRTFEDGVDCCIKYVDNVERTKTGKLKIVVNNMI